MTAYTTQDLAYAKGTSEPVRLALFAMEQRIASLSAANHDAVVNQAIVRTLLPQLFFIVDELLSLEGKPIPKELKVQARKLLPSQYAHSFEAGKRGQA